MSLSCKNSVRWIRKWSVWMMRRVLLVSLLFLILMWSSDLNAVLPTGRPTDPLKKHRPSWRQMHQLEKRLQELVARNPHDEIGLPPGPQQNRPLVLIVDGLIFQLQGNPRGISIVWKNLIPQLAKLLPAPNQVYFVNRAPGAALPTWISQQPGVITVNYEQNLDYTVEQLVLKEYRQRNESTESVRDDDPIIVALDTYYQFPSGKNFCKVMMYHDMIPERTGMYHGPGSEYYPRIEALSVVNSIVAVSQSTARDVVKDYKQHVFKVASDQFHDKEDGDKMPETSGSIVSAIQNRLSRNLFKGPATADQILQFRKHYKIWSSSNPIHEINGVPYDFLLTVGTDYPYKNYGTFFAALDLLADDVLDRISIVMVGRGGMNGDEFNQMKRHPVHVYSDGHKEERKAATVSSQVPLRVHVLSYIEEKDLPVVYSAAVGLVFISSYEGFGLPLAEALTSGTLAVATNASSLPEVGGPREITTYVQNPQSPEQVSAAMMELLQVSDEERVLKIKYAQKWIERFGGGPEGEGHGWDEMAKLIVAHIRSKKHRRDECYVPKWTKK